MRNRTGILATLAASAALAAATAGCGQVSYFDVDAVVVNQNGSSIMATDLYSVDTCDVNVSGATTDSFQLSNCANGGPPKTYTSLEIGKFQYGTTSESGTLTFEITLRSGDVSKKPLGMGSATGTISAGKHVPLMLPITPDPSAF